MRILHTSDLHIGHTLYGSDRRREMGEMLRWLVKTIREEKAEVLIAAGDIFDRSAPGAEAQQLYYNFLRDVRLSTDCRHVVVIAGNHDSPSLIDAPREFAEALDVTIAGLPAASGPELEREVKVLRNRETGAPELIVCAVPYISESSLRSFAAWARGQRQNGENETEARIGDELQRGTEAGLQDGGLQGGGRSPEEPPCGEDPERTCTELMNREERTAEGMKLHYQLAADLALKKRRELGAAGENIPIIALGHLATASCSLGGGEFIGTIRAFDPCEIFPEAFSYVALGHIHKAQIVSKHPNWRFSGSPLKLDFGEEDSQSVCIVDFDGSRFADVKTVPVPVFQSLISIRGSLKTIEKRLQELKLAWPGGENAPKVWCSVIQTEGEPTQNFRGLLENLTRGSGIEILLAKIELSAGERDAARGQSVRGERLRDLEPEEVFRRMLTARGFTDEKSPNFTELMATFHEAMALREEDFREEV